MRLLVCLGFQKASLLQFAQQRTTPGEQNKYQSVHVSVCSQADWMNDGFTGAEEEETAKRDNTSAGDSADAERRGCVGIQHQDAHAPPQ